MSEEDERTVQLDLTAAAAAAAGIGYEQGWRGAFTRHHAEGAYPNGIRVFKVGQDPDGDRTPLGTRGTVLGSLGGEELGMTGPTGDVIRFVYFVEWDNMPHTAVGMVDWKIDVLVPREQ